MYENFWGSKEFLRFNSESNWTIIKGFLTQTPDAPYYRYNQPKGRKQNEKAYHSTISMQLLKKVIAGTSTPIRTERGTPLDMGNYSNSRNYLSAAFQNAVRRAQLTEQDTHGHVSLHELRDTRKTEATTHDVKYEVSEFAMGHVVDSRGYEKCWRDDRYVWNELSKLRNTTE
jgi:hypothetical protein